MASGKLTPEKAATYIQHANINMRDYPVSQLVSEVAEGAKLTKGNMYQVNIPDQHAARMLDWDKPLSEQAKNVQDAVKGSFPNGWVGPKDPTGAQIVEMFGGRQSNAAMQSAGIPGIKYLDQGSRNVTDWIVKHPKGGENVFNTEAAAQAFLKRNPESTLIAPKQTSNFVVFDPAILEDVTRK